MRRKGSLTIEASLLMPFLFFVLLTIIQISFFLYNREAVTVMASQAALQGVQMEQAGKNTIEKKLDKFLKEETEQRLVFVDKVDYKVSVTLKKVKVSISLSQKTLFRLLDCTVTEEMARLNPASVLWESERWRK